ncbi:hypothetical protein WJX72_010298 [[Myrmecia] bisecta]|uniref:Protein kinase domain-containing protein n=1 Tax=[Myrmecia] bisecta TaxID=41462 RepID=A0AAW1Q8K5_9CHLO
MDNEVSDLQPSSREDSGEAKCSFRPDDFQHQEPIGKGKDSVIYKAVCVKLGGKLVAVKVYTKLKLSSSKDIKLENIFIADDGRVKLGDFGLTMSMKQELAISPVGTVEYMAPEVVALPPVEMVTNGTIAVSSITPCSEKVDLWALGVTLYELLTGHLPFDGRDKAEIKKNILEGKLKPLPGSLSPQCISFITNMLAQSPADRLSAEELLQHPFVQLFFIASSPVSQLATAKLSDSATSLKQLKGHLSEQIKPVIRLVPVAAPGSPGAMASLPASFSARHQGGVQESSQPELLGPSRRERDSSSLIRAHHGYYADGSMSSASSITSVTSAIPHLDEPHTPQQRAPKKRLSLRRMFTAKKGAQMREIEASQSTSVEESARSTMGTSILQKVAGLFKGIVASPDSDTPTLTAANLQELLQQQQAPHLQQQQQQSQAVL